MYGVDLSQFVGMIANQRSGTHLLRGAFNSHPDIFCDGEPMYRCAPKSTAALRKWFQKYKHEKRKLVLDIKYDQITEPVELMLQQIPVFHLIRRDIKRMFLSELMRRFYHHMATSEEHRIAKERGYPGLVKLKIGMDHYAAYEQYVRQTQERFEYLAQMTVFYEEITSGDQDTLVLPEWASYMLCGFVGVKPIQLITDTRKETPHEYLDTHLKLVRGDCALQRA